ncbi:S-layer homology domain-containing protein [Citricoccus zhacaiensis]
MLVTHRRRITGVMAILAVTVTLAGPVSASTAPAAEASTNQACVTPDFADVPREANFYEAITWLRCGEISTGYANGTYAPYQQITRGETAQLLYRFSGEIHSAGTRIDFNDVPSSRSAFTAVSWMQAKGYSTGYTNGTFGVDQPITRGELSAFLYRMSGEEATAPAESPFPDLGNRDNFYTPATWFYGTGMVSGYADGTFRPHRAVTRGESARFLYALETRVHGAPPTYTVPAIDPPGNINATGGKGGAYRDVKAITYSNGITSSQYHLYAGHLNASKPHGIMIHLHGDGGFEYNQPQWSTIPAYEKLAEQHGLMLVVPSTPDKATNTWWRKDSSGTYAADLLKDLGRKYNLDLNQVYWTGYSGGADTVARHMMNSHSAGWTGGAAVIVAGGGIYGQKAPLRPISSALMNNYEMHWVVGADDTPARGGASGDFDAVQAARLGSAFYSGLGMKTSLTIKPGMDHWEIAPSGPAKLAEVLASR